MEEINRKLILVRHSVPEIVPNLPASQWRLSTVGRSRCREMARQLAIHDLVAVVASEEPKATETGRIVADILGIPFEVSSGLHEHERHNVQSLFDQEQFQAQVASVFEHPSELVFGNETADQAHRRFANALTAVLERHPSGNLAVVTHGTVLTLFVARAAKLEPVPFWKHLGLPAFAVLSLPSFDLEEVVKQIGQDPNP